MSGPPTVFRVLPLHQRHVSRQPRGTMLAARLRQFVSLTQGGRGGHARPRTCAAHIRETCKHFLCET
eukprot:1192006-Prorocentrum_minimum.AAC.1